MKTKTMVLCAVFAALMCILSVITIPTGIVPVTLGTLGLMLTGVILGAKRAPIAVAVYILLGVVGLPVFSGFKAGIQTLFGPTGGYLWSYIPVAAMIGLFAEKLPEKKILAIVKLFLGCVIGGIVVCYTLGTVQFMLQQQVNLSKALAVCVIPFIPFDLVKAIIAAYLGLAVKNALLKAGLMK